MRRIAAGISTVTLVGYPGVVYGSLRAFEPRVAMMVMLGVLLPALLLRAGGGSSQRPQLRTLGFIPWFSAGLLVIGIAIGELGLALYVPVVINALLWVAFTSTLWRGPPLIERFARLVVVDLHDPEVRWCRAWTVGWSWFFLLNGAVIFALATMGPLSWWALYTGLVSYLGVGLLLGIEYVLRKLRFGRWGTHPLDRLLRWVFMRNEQGR